MFSSMDAEKNNFHGEDRALFRGRLNNTVHPSENISRPYQLKGRDAPLRQMRDCFETPGSHPFIWGPRGVGKTSLGHTACEEYSELVTLAAAVACEKDTAFGTLLTDLLRYVISNNKVSIRDKSFTASVSAFGVSIGAKLGDVQGSVSVEGPNHATAYLQTIFSQSRFPSTIPTIIIDEFDRLKNRDTFEMLSGTLKQISVVGLNLKIILCGVTEDLNDLLGAHESVERYIYGVELPPLTHDAVWQIISDVEQEFSVRFNRGQHVRISQIASGYPAFAHLILKNIVLRAYELGYEGAEITNDLYKEGISESAQQAATRLKTAYENAIKKGTDRYIEVLWALANSTYLDRQFKDIVGDYERIMMSRPHRAGYETEKNNGQDIRNALNSLTTRGVLKKGKTGWYQFCDPMLRGYVRMVAEREGVELSDEAFPA